MCLCVDTYESCYVYEASTASIVSIVDYRVAFPNAEQKVPVRVKPIKIITPHIGRCRVPCAVCRPSLSTPPYCWAAAALPCAVGAVRGRACVDV